jgi:NitT/TauT family transport system substrate-binding protein
MSCKKSTREALTASQTQVVSTETPAATRSVTLQLNWTPEPEFGGFYEAVRQNLYEEVGLNVDIKAGAAGIQTWKMVASRNVPFAIAESGEILRAHLKDANLVALYAVYQTTPQAIMVHKESGVTSMAEIFQSGRIKKVAVESGLPYVKFLEKKYGFGKVEMMQYGGNLSLFLADKTMAQQCFVFGEPVTARERGANVVAFSTADSGFNPYLAVVITHRDFYDKNPEVVRNFIAATRKGWEEYMKDPTATNEYMKEKGSPMSLDAMKIAAELQNAYLTGPDTAELGHMSLARWRELATQLKEIGELEELPDVSKILMPSGK